MVTLGIVAAVLAALLLLFIICDGDVSGGCACFCSCLLLLFIILMGVALVSDCIPRGDRTDLLDT